MKSDPRFNLGDTSLFGNEAAEEEDIDIFQSYAVQPEGVDRFLDPDERIAVARAYKGEGKSALIVLMDSRIHDPDNPQIVVNTTATRVSPKEATDYPDWVREWKRNIIGHVATEVGNKIGFAWRDDEMALVEESERQGFKSRSLVSAILTRIGRLSFESGGAKASLEKQEAGPLKNPEEVVKRWVEGRPPIWVFLDDVDRNFDYTTEQIYRIGSFFDAVRELRRAVPEFNVRATIRPNVWTLIKLRLESMSHMEQYMVDLSWSEQGLRGLLAARLRAYLRRTDQKQILEHLDIFRPDRETIRLLFEDPMVWGRKQRPPHVVLYTLSKHRPRWIIELCKVSAAAALRRESAQINKEHILADYSEFGRRRIEDTIAEFSSYCPQISEVIDAFHGQAEEYSTDDLFSLINKRLLSHVSPNIRGITGGVRAREVAAFLFEVGFINARRDKEDRSYEHITFSESPSLLRSRTALDRGLRWEIHPVFRQALEIRDIEGKPITDESRFR